MFRRLFFNCVNRKLVLIVMIGSVIVYRVVMGIAF